MPLLLSPPAGPLALAAALVLPLLARLSPQGPPPAPVRVAEVRLELVQERRVVTGEVRAARRSLLAAREAGLVAELLVREGSPVEAGQVVARLDAVRLESELAILAARRALAEAVSAERQASAARARLDLEVLEALAARDAVNPKELADARTEVLVAEARVEVARQELCVLDAQRELLGQRLADMQPRAPFAGVVVTRRADVGEWVDVGSALVEIVSTEELEAWLNVPQAYHAALVAHTEPLTATSDASGAAVVLAGWRTVPAIDPSARTFLVIAELRAGSGLAPGMSLRASVPMGAEVSELTVPRDAILRGEIGPYVYVAAPGAEGQPPSAMPVAVDLLFDHGARSVVRAARLQAGLLVVVEGNERLWPGAPLAPSEAQAR